MNQPSSTYARLAAALKALAEPYGKEDKPVPCVGCGAQRPADRCLGCFHDFKPSPSKAYKPVHGGYPG